MHPCLPLAYYYGLFKICEPLYFSGMREARNSNLIHRLYILTTCNKSNIAPCKKLCLYVRETFTTQENLYSDSSNSAKAPALCHRPSGITRGEFGGFNPPIRIEAVIFHSRKVTAIKYYNVSLTTRRTINSHNLRKTNHLGRVVRLIAW